MLTGAIIKFGPCAVDLDLLCLHGPAGPQHLRRKSFDVLRHLVENAGRIVSREEVTKAVWRDVVVGEESLTQCIGEIRRAIGDHQQVIIKTVPRRGYLIDVSVSVMSKSTVLPAPAASGAMGLTAADDRPSIAVLAFDNRSDDPRQDYLSDGITEDIITELSRCPELVVIARNSTFRYKGQGTGPSQIGQELGVRYILAGSVRRDGDRLRITTQLVESETSRCRWAERYDRKVDDIFTIQDEVARTIVSILSAHVSRAELERTATKPPATWQAYDFYMRAADTLASFWPSFGPTAIHETRRLLDSALAIDARYARAHGLMSHTYAIAWTNPIDDDFMKPTTLGRAHTLALKAVQLEPNLPIARAHLGSALTYKRQLDAALEEFDRAMTLNPNFTDWRLAGALIFSGQAERAITVAQSLMRLDPYYHPLASGWLGLAYYHAGHYIKALSPLRECLSRMPNYRSARAWIAATYAQLGLRKEAEHEVRNLLELDPRHTIGGYYRQVPPYRSDADAEHLFNGLRKAGLPEN